MLPFSAKKLLSLSVDVIVAFGLTKASSKEGFIMASTVILTAGFFSQQLWPTALNLRKRRNNDLRRINSVAKAAFECYIFTCDA